MSTITMQINDQAVSGKTGMTILELAGGMGIVIPTLCHDPHLSPAGACRICLVEDTARGVLLPACVTAIAPGMIIQTNSPRVLETRRTILQLLLASHPESCIICDKGNHCKLRALAADLGLGISSLDPMPQFFPTHDFNPFFKRDMSKCILCGKCIRGDQELVVERVLDYSHRGFPARPTTFQNLPLEEAGCTFCGTCLSLCPTGALIETGLSRQGSISQNTASVCPHCACGCSLSLETCSDRIIRIVPGANPSPRGGTLCIKGHFGFHYIHSPERLRNPLIRKNGDLRETTWDEALAFLLKRFQSLIGEYGSKAIGCLAGPQLSNEEFYLFQKLARQGLKTPNLDNGSSLYAASLLKAMNQSIGLQGLTSPLENILQSEVILVVGADPTETAPVAGYMIKRALSQHQAKLILIDPRKTKLASWATLWLRPHPGTDLALIQGLTQTLLNQNLWNQETVQTRTEGFQEWRSWFLTQDIPGSLSTTGEEEALIQETARTLAEARSIALIIGDGISQQWNASATLLALFNLIFLLGLGDQPALGVYPLLKENNAFGAWEMGVLPEFLPGYQPVSEEQARRNMESKWGTKISGENGLSALEMIAAAQVGLLKGLYLVSEDPLGTYPDRVWVKEALERLEFLVVQDLFLTETAQKAHLVLPAAGPAEKEGTYTSLERRVRRAHKAISPPGRAKPDGEIFALIVKALNNQGHSPVNPESSLWPEIFPEVFREIRETVPGYDRFTLAGLEKSSFPPIQDLRQSKPRVFKIPEIPPDQTSQDPDYPFTLITGPLHLHLGPGTRTGRDPRLKALTPPPEISLSSSDADRLKIDNGDKVRIQSRRGSLVLPLRISDQVPAGVVFLPLPYPELQINTLFESRWDPLSKGSRHYHCSIRLSKE